MISASTSANMNVKIQGLWKRPCTLAFKACVFIDCVPLHSGRIVGCHAHPFRNRTQDFGAHVQNRKGELNSVRESSRQRAMQEMEAATAQTEKLAPLALPLPIDRHWIHLPIEIWSGCAIRWSGLPLQRCSAPLAGMPARTDRRGPPRQRLSWSGDAVRRHRPKPQMLPFARRETRRHNVPTQR